MNEFLPQMEIFILDKLIKMAENMVKELFTSQICQIAREKYIMETFFMDIKLDI